MNKIFIILSLILVFIFIFGCILGYSCYVKMKAYFLKCDIAKLTIDVEELQSTVTEIKRYF